MSSFPFGSTHVLAALLILGAAILAPSAQAVEGLPDNSIPPLVNRLRAAPNAVIPASGSGPLRVLGISIEDAPRVFAPVTPWWPLPDGWRPPDLTGQGGIPHVLGQPVSALILPDLESLVAAADHEGVDISVLSAFRSSEDQNVIFENAVLRVLRQGNAATREDAERAVSRFSARPQHSQHQLGTALDFTTWEVGYGLGARFGETRAGLWLRDHAWEYGFVFPYTAASEPRTGYRSEPWHLRWVGRPLAAFMQSEGYLESAFPVADDYVLSAYELTRELVPGATLGE